MIKISDLIKNLVACKNKHGDLEVCIDDVSNTVIVDDLEDLEDGTDWDEDNNRYTIFITTTKIKGKRRKPIPLSIGRI